MREIKSCLLEILVNTNCRHLRKLKRLKTSTLAPEGVSRMIAMQLCGNIYV